MFIKNKSKSQSGDTIVEVLIALIIIAVILTGAYVASNRSLNTSRASQERGEATKLVEGQLEQLKVLGALAPTTAQPFCLDPSNNPITTASDDNLSSPNYPAGCIKQQSGSGVNYYLSIQKDTTTNVFTARARWYRVGGGVNSEVKIVYKVL